jgi:hypothetical protein
MEALAPLGEPAPSLQPQPETASEPGLRKRSFFRLRR